MFGGGGGSAGQNANPGGDGGANGSGANPGLAGSVDNISIQGQTPPINNARGGDGGAGEFTVGGGGGGGIANGSSAGGGGGGYGGGGGGGNENGSGGGGGGTGGSTAGDSVGGPGANGCGPFSGSAGAASNPGIAGGAGGYRSSGGNGDTTTGKELYLGSGGGGGGGNNTGTTPQSPGGGGAAGGGFICLVAYSTMTVNSSARLLSNGAAGGGGGQDDNLRQGGGGGKGAGGTVLLDGGNVTNNCTGVNFSVRGGNNSTTNGGTVKIFGSSFSGSDPGASYYGRLYKNILPSTSTVSDGVGADIDLSSSAIKLSANWTASNLTSPRTLNRYEFKIGNTSKGKEVLNWTSCGTNTSTSSYRNLQSGKRYFITVRAVDDTGFWGEEATSDGVLIDTHPPTGQSINSVIAHISSVTVTINTASDPTPGSGNNSTPYYIECSSSSSFAWTTANSGWQSGTSWKPTVLTPNTTYHFRVKARDVVENKSAWSAPATKVTLCNVPVSMTITSPSYTQLDLNWDANGNPDGTKYIAHCSPDGFATVYSSTVTAATAAFNSLTRNTEYEVRVYAVNHEGVCTGYLGSYSRRTQPGTWQEMTIKQTGKNSYGFEGDGVWTWKVPANGGSLVTITAYVRYNSNYGAASKPKITLSNKGINDSVQMTGGADTWEKLTVSGTPSGKGVLFLKVEGFSTAVDAKYFVDDIQVNQP